MAPWAQKFVHGSDKEIGWNVPLEQRLQAGLLLVNIQKLKQDNKCKLLQPPKANPVIIEKLTRHDWTGMGGIGNTKDNEK